MTTKKPGRVVRLSPKLQRYVESRLQKQETLDACLRRLVGLPAKQERGKFEVRAVYVLPSDIFEFASDARGKAVLRAVRTKQPHKIEKPIEMRRVE